MGWRDVLRSLIDSDEPDETGEISEIEQGVADAADEDEGGIGEADLTDEGDDGEGDEGAADEGSGDEVEGTPGDEQESPEVAELRQTLVEQAAEIETLRNRLAAAGLEDEIADEVDEIEDDEDTDDEDVVAEFEKDYAARQAMLAEITKEN